MIALECGRSQDKSVSVIALECGRSQVKSVSVIALSVVDPRSSQLV